MEHLHRLTLEAARQFDQAAPIDGFVHSGGADSFHVRVHHTRTALALDFVERLARMCEVQGFGLQPGKGLPGKPAAQAITVSDEQLYLSLTEPRRRRLYQPTRAEQARLSRGRSLYLPKYSHYPSGELKLLVEGERGTRLQMTIHGNGVRNANQRMQSVPTRLIALADGLADSRRREALAAERERQAEEARENLRAAVEAEAEEIAQLRNNACAWVEARNLRAFIAAVSAINGPEWTEWAFRQADRLDPLTLSPASILDTPASRYAHNLCGPWEEEHLPAEPE